MKELRTFEFLLLSCGTCYVAVRSGVFPPDFFLEWRPISFYKFLGGPIADSWLSFFKAVWFFSLLFAGLGFFRRVLTPIGCIFGVIALGHNYNFGNVYHGNHLYIGAVCLTAFFPFKDESPRLFLQMMKVFVVFVMCLTGVQKLYYGGGLEWAFSDAFYIRVASNPYHPYFARFVLESPLWVSQLVAGYSLIIAELLAPLALINDRFGKLYFFIWVSFHIGVTLVFTNHYMFYSQIFVYSAFLNFRKYNLLFFIDSIKSSWNIAKKA